MTSTASLTFTLELHERLHAHLFPGDGLEAAAIILCTRAPGPRLRLLASEVVLVPHGTCKTRESDYLTWPGTAIEDAIDKAEVKGMSIILMHSHPGDLFEFSRMDDESDLAVVPSLHAAIEQLHGTAIMVPSGAVRARTYDHAMQKSEVELVTVVGHDVRRWWSDKPASHRPFTFGAEMRAEMGRLSAAVIGVSGTGSIVAEQLARMGIGRLVLVDHDHVEDRNLNRILHSTLEHARQETPKVEMFARAVEGYREGEVAEAVPKSILERDAVEIVAQCDVVFSCVDKLDARLFSDLMSSSFLQPLFDVGVSIPTRKVNGVSVITEVCTRVDYVRPGGPTLRDRGVYTPETLRVEELRDSDPAAYEKQLKDGYIKGRREEAPDVIALNMRAASDCCMEFLARYFGYRHEPNEGYSRTVVQLAAGDADVFSERSFAVDANPWLALGDQEPLLGLPRLRRKLKK